MSSCAQSKCLHNTIIIKKNFLEVMIFFCAHQVDETSVFRHKDERRVKTIEEESVSVSEDAVSLENELLKPSTILVADEENLCSENGSSDGDSDGKDSVGNADDDNDNDDVDDDEKEMDDPADAIVHNSSGELKSSETPGCLNIKSDIFGTPVIVSEKPHLSAAKDEPDDGTDFPDTSIQLQHVKGDK